MTKSVNAFVSCRCEFFRDSDNVYLNATPITDAGRKHLAKIKTLKSLNLTECQLSEAALDDLQDTLPWCRITK